MQRRGQHCHAERPTRRTGKRPASPGRPSFLESSLRLLSACTNDSETTHPGRRNAHPSGLPAGAAVPPAGRCRCRNEACCKHRLFWQRVRRYACTSCIDTSSSTAAALWPVTAQRQPSAGRALAPPAAIDTNLGILNQSLVQQPVAARRNAVSLISYQALPTDTPLQTPRLLPAKQSVSRQALHWSSFKKLIGACFRSQPTAPLRSPMGRRSLR